MTTFTEMYDETIRKTARPELIGLTKSAVSQATLMAHHVDFFPRDRAISLLTYAQSTLSPVISVPNIYDSILRLRALELIKGMDATNNALPVEDFEHRDYSDFYDQYGGLRYHVWDVIGTTLKIVPALQSGFLEVIYYQNPQVSESSYSSWIADMYKEELAWWAAAIVQARSGAAELAQLNMRMNVEPFKELLISSHLLSHVN